MRYVLDGRRISTRGGFYDELARQAPLPAHFGRNLDALWDVLTGELPGPLEIVWEHASASRRAMGAEEHDRLVKLLRDAAAEREDLSVTLRG